MDLDLNCDMGESFGVYQLGADEQLMPYITSANVACGYHAGDPMVLDRTVARARRYGVAVGAHPGYPDLAGFGRRPMALTPEEVENCVLYQIGALAAFCRAHGVTLTHVKAHGALYNAAAEDVALARALARAIARFDRDLLLVGLASSAAMRAAAGEAGLAYAAEAFADRGYNPDGSLQSRRLPGSLIVDPAQAAAQAVAIAAGHVIAHDGSIVPIAAATLCLHGDNPSAAANAQAVAAALAAAGIRLRPLRGSSSREGRISEKGAAGGSDQ